ncbi:D-alanyl-D-alanine carboxypeptidase family protein [Effusibacillus pohliae]|uniref:D-alanyl-D-alanine carboxypeptidase family protein n=1 Tax=Effusibacillus pohliae TaxID=232270 RepID=UPI0003804E44|nr:D-alanyl-D-alanine carboxypeptidase family protein [Effusibacillus pohliae]
MLRKLIIWLLAILLVISALPLFAFAEGEPQIQSEGAFLMDMKSGQVLYQKNAHQRFYPASITKILTCIIALENSRLDEQVRVSKRATEQEGNRVYLAEGEYQSMENLLYGLMLNSGNDAAVAIAEHISGSVEAFADLMNQKAKQIGAKESHFVNPNGLHDPEHYTTPYDMTLIARYAMQNPKFREIVKTETRPWHGKEWNSVLYNINPMLYNYDGANGVKTGYTDQARQTMVVSAARGDREIIGTLMRADLKQTIRLDATALLDYGFSHYDTQKIAEKDKVVTSLTISDDLKTDVKVASDYYYTFPAKRHPDIQSRIRLHPPAKPPVAAGTTVGELEFTADGQTIGSVPLVTAGEIPAPRSVIEYVRFNYSFKWWHALLPFPILLAGLIYRRIRLREAAHMHIQNFRDYRNQNY